MKHTLTGLVHGVFMMRGKEAVESSPLNEVEVTWEGFAGDRHAGMTRRSDSRAPFYPRGTLIRNSRQVTLVALEELAEVAQAMGIAQILPEWLGANLAISGIPRLTQLPPGTRLFFPQDTVLVVQAANGPCLGPGEVIQSYYPDIPDLASQFPKKALNKRGLTAWVERPGKIAAGERVQADVPEQVIWNPAT